MNRNRFWVGDTFAVVKAMHRTGDYQGVVEQWKRNIELWSGTLGQGTPEGNALRAWLPYWQARPFYTSAELVPIIPALVVALGNKEKPPPQKSPTRLAYELDYAGLPILKNQNGTDLFYPPHGGAAQRFYIVERIIFWRDKFLTQEEFENVLHG